ncbi:MAG: hypothetical protein U0792_11255 [Gemmataceae bacterium]
MSGSSSAAVSKTPGIPAPRGFLEAFGKPAFAISGSGRLELAKAVTDPCRTRW